MAFFISANTCARMEAGTRKGRDGVQAIETSMRAFYLEEVTSWKRV